MYIRKEVFFAERQTDGRTDGRTLKSE
jgi:hypothetical protein